MEKNSDVAQRKAETLSKEPLAPSDAGEHAYSPTEEEVAAYVESLLEDEE